MSLCLIQDTWKKELSIYIHIYLFKINNDKLSKKIKKEKRQTEENRGKKGKSAKRQERTYFRIKVCSTCFLKIMNNKFWIDKGYRLLCAENGYTPDWRTEWVSKRQPGEASLLKLTLNSSEEKMDFWLIPYVAPSINLAYLY